MTINEAITLSPEHLAALRDGSGISDEVIQARVFGLSGREEA